MIRPIIQTILIGLLVGLIVPSCGTSLPRSPQLVGQTEGISESSKRSSTDNDPDLPTWLKNHPEIKVARLKLESAKLRAGRAAHHTPPAQLAFGGGVKVDAGAVSPAFSVALEQEIPSPRQFKLIRYQSDVEVILAQAEYEAKVREISDRAWVNLQQYVVLKERKNRILAYQKMAKEWTLALERGFEKGGISQPNLGLAYAKLEQLNLVSMEADQSMSLVILALSRMLNLPVNIIIGQTEQLEPGFPSEFTELQAILESVHHHRLDLVSLWAKQEITRLEAERLRVSRFPGVTIGGGYEIEGTAREQLIKGYVGIPVPLLTRTSKVIETVDQQSQAAEAFLKQQIEVVKSEVQLRYELLSRSLVTLNQLKSRSFQIVSKLAETREKGVALGTETLLSSLIQLNEELEVLEAYYMAVNSIWLQELEFRESAGWLGNEKLHLEKVFTN